MGRRGGGLATDQCFPQAAQRITCTFQQPSGLSSAIGPGGTEQAALPPMSYFIISIWEPPGLEVVAAGSKGHPCRSTPAVTGAARNGPVGEMDELRRQRGAWDTPR